MTDQLFDLISMGRVSMDLFAENIGAPFVDITGFATGVGGSPSNIAIGSSRLGLNVALLTAVGEDEVGRFVLHYLQQEGVDPQYIPRKPDARTGMALVGIQPPDKFPLLFYRENPADIHLTIDDLLAVPFTRCRALLLSGTALSRGSCREATLYAAEVAQSSEATTFMDLDLRPRPVVPPASLWPKYTHNFAAPGCRHRHRRGVFCRFDARSGSSDGRPARDRSATRNAGADPR